MSEHTHWRIIQGDQIVDAAGFFMASTRIAPTSVNRHEPAERAVFIIKAVNSHADLVKALTAIVKANPLSGHLECPQTKIARAALNAAVEGGRQP